MGAMLAGPCAVPWREVFKVCFLAAGKTLAAAGNRLKISDWWLLEHDFYFPIY